MQIKKINHVPIIAMIFCLLLGNFLCGVDLSVPFIKQADPPGNWNDTKNCKKGTVRNGFSIIPALFPNVTVISPNGGENLETGTTHTITWASSETFDNVTIEYSTDNGTNWTGIIATTPNNGMYEWLVPDNPSDTCLIRISETSGEPSDVSDGVFSIIAPSADTVTITSPNGGEILIVGTTYEITWTYTGTFENVTIEYSTDNRTNWTEITASASNTGSYEWQVPYHVSSNCLVRVCRQISL